MQSRTSPARSTLAALHPGVREEKWSVVTAQPNLCPSSPHFSQGGLDHLQVQRRHVQDRNQPPVIPDDAALLHARELNGNPLPGPAEQIVEISMRKRHRDG